MTGVGKGDVAAAVSGDLIGRYRLNIGSSPALAEFLDVEDVYVDDEDDEDDAWPDGPFVAEALISVDAFGNASGKTRKLSNVTYRANFRRALLQLTFNGTPVGLAWQQTPVGLSLLALVGIAYAVQDVFDHELSAASAYVLMALWLHRDLADRVDKDRVVEFVAAEDKRYGRSTQRAVLDSLLDVLEEAGCIEDDGLQWHLCESVQLELEVEL